MWLPGKILPRRWVYSVLWWFSTAEIYHRTNTFLLQSSLNVMTHSSRKQCCSMVNRLNQRTRQRGTYFWQHSRLFKPKGDIQIWMPPFVLVDGLPIWLIPIQNALYPLWRLDGPDQRFDRRQIVCTEVVLNPPYNLYRRLWIDEIGRSDLNSAGSGNDKL